MEQGKPLLFSSLEEAIQEAEAAFKREEVTDAIRLFVMKNRSAGKYWVKRPPFNRDDAHAAVVWRDGRVDKTVYQ